MKIISSYIIGLLLSTILTLTGYILVMAHLRSYHEFISHPLLIFLVLLLAFLQLLVQSFFFLQLWKKDSATRWNLGFFITTFVGVLVIVIGSVWIMYHLNYNMTPQQVNQYIDNQSGF